MSDEVELRIRVKNGVKTVEIPYACGRVFIALMSFIFGFGGAVMASIASLWPVIFGGLFLGLSVYGCWLLFSNPRYLVNLETGEGRLVSWGLRGEVESTKFSIREFNQIFVNSRRHPIGNWMVTLVDVHGADFILAPCVTRQHGIGIAHLLSEKFNLRNHGMMG